MDIRYEAHEGSANAPILIDDDSEDNMSLRNATTLMTQNGRPNDAQALLMWTFAKGLMIRVRPYFTEKLDYDSITRTKERSLSESLWIYLCTLQHRTSDPDRLKAAGALRQQSRSITIALLSDLLGVPVDSLIEGKIFESARIESEVNEEVIELARHRHTTAFGQFAESAQRDSSNYLLEQSDALEWLLSRIQTLLTLSSRHTELGQITRRIATSVRRIKSEHEHVSAIFNVDWNLAEFMKEQYKDPTLLADVIVLVSDKYDVQAARVADYIAQTWPLTGPELLSALEQWIRADSAQETESLQMPLLDGLLMISGKSLRIGVEAPIFAVVELGEILSWLCSACRVSTHSNQQAIARTIFSSPTNQDKSDNAPTSFRLHSDIFGTHHLSQGSKDCWRQLFRNVCVAEAFPVKARSSPAIEKGLEIPFDMMIGLAGADMATDYQGQLMIKGWRTILVPTAHTHSTLVWHILATRSGRILYSAWKGEGDRDIDIQQVYKSTRHFLGWTKAAGQHAGSQDGKYGPLDQLSLDPPSRECTLDSATLGATYFLTASATFKFGEKDEGINTPEPTLLYKEVVDALSKLPVLLYDTDSDRGWLIDGASAALHILRYLMERPKFRDSPTFDISQFNYADTTPGETATVKALELNRDIILLAESDENDPTKKVTRTAGVKVRHSMLNVFDQMRDTWNRQMERRGLSLKSFTWNPKLEGWKFRDVVEEIKPKKSGAFAIHSSADQWHHFIRKINTIVLFGKNFGEIISASNDVCQHFRTVPTQHSCLAVSTPPLRQIIRNEGDAISVPITMVPELFWNIDADPFTCDCDNQRSGIGHTCPRVQEISRLKAQLKSTPSGLPGQIMHSPDFGKAAVIFSERWVTYPSRTPLHIPPAAYNPSQTQQ